VRARVAERLDRPYLILLLTDTAERMNGLVGTGGARARAAWQKRLAVVAATMVGVTLGALVPSVASANVSGASRITTVAGTTYGFSGDGSLATTAQLAHPADMAMDGDGHLFIADTHNNRIRRVDAISGVITTVAGTGTAGYNGDSIPAVSASLNAPEGVAVDSAGHIYIADAGNRRVRRVDSATGSITTVVGNGDHTYVPEDGPATTIALYYPNDVALDSYGHLYVASSYWVSRIDPAGVAYRVAGTGSHRADIDVDHIPGRDAWIDWVAGIAIDTSGNLFISDFWNSRLRRVDGTSNQITTVVGNRTWGYGEEPITASIAPLTYPYGVTVAPDGALVFVDGTRVRRVNPASNTVTTIAGDTSTSGFAGDGGAANAAKLDFPMGVTFSPDGDLYIADAYNDRIRIVSATDITGPISGGGGDNDPPPPPPAETFVYVALGDSYQSGEGAAYDLPTADYLSRGYENGTNYPDQIGPQEDTSTRLLSPNGDGCHRALRNYAKINRDRFKPDAQIVLVDRTCSGATIEPNSNGRSIVGTAGSETYSDGSQVSEAIERLDRAGFGRGGVDLVTVGMGGNDAHFGDLVQACVLPGLLEKLVERHPDAPAEITAASNLDWVNSCERWDQMVFHTDDAIVTLAAKEKWAAQQLLNTFQSARILALDYPNVVPSTENSPDYCGGLRASDMAFARRKANVTVQVAGVGGMVQGLPLKRSMSRSMGLWPCLRPVSM
jgi:sugar lactone lactonase YvrE